MEDMSRRKYEPKLVLLDPAHVALIVDEARRRDPDYDTKPKGSTRIQNAIVRDFFDFTTEHYSQFVAWVSARKNAA